MTIDEVLRVVRDETGQDAQSDSQLDDLVDDSLEFTNLIARVSEECGEISDATIARIHTVDDLYRAAAGELL